MNQKPDIKQSEISRIVEDAKSYYNARFKRAVVFCCFIFIVSLAGLVGNADFTHGIPASLISVVLTLISLIAFALYWNLADGKDQVNRITKQWSNEQSNPDTK